MSLGSWTAVITAANEPMVRKCALFLNGGGACDTTWTGLSQRFVREGLEPHITLAQLKRAWALNNLSLYADKLVREGLDLQFVLAKRDVVVRPEYSRVFLYNLEAAGARPDVHWLNCGHHSMGKFPYHLRAAWHLWRFLRSRMDHLDHAL